MEAVTRAVASGDDLYGLLGLSPDASDDDIRHAYRTLARAHHPDANPGEAMAEDFRRVAAAYEVLGDERERRAYDRALWLQRMATERSARPGPVASHVAPGPSGAVTSRGRAASANPADHVSHSAHVEASRLRREPVDEWRLVSVLGRIVVAAAAAIVIAVVALMVVAADARVADPPPPTIWCKTPEGWFDCWQATSPDGS
jgi:hypothetical protein